MVLLGLDSLDLVLYFLEEHIDHVFQIDPLPSVGVEPDEYPLAAVDHEEVVVADLFVALVVGPVRELVRLNRKKGGGNEPTVIDTAAVGTVAPSRVKGRIMDELSGKSFVERVPDTDLFGVFVDYGAPRVIRKHALETSGTISVVFSATTP